MAMCPCMETVHLPYPIQGNQYVRARGLIGVRWGAAFATLTSACSGGSPSFDAHAAVDGDVLIALHAAAAVA